MPLPQQPGLSHAELMDRLRRFFVDVSSPDALPEFRLLARPQLRAEAVSRCAAAATANNKTSSCIYDDNKVIARVRADSISCLVEPACLKAGEAFYNPFWSRITPGMSSLLPPPSHC
jgi:hypothetical protein